MQIQKLFPHYSVLINITDLDLPEPGSSKSNSYAARHKPLSNKPLWIVNVYWSSHFFLVGQFKLDFMWFCVRRESVFKHPQASCQTPGFFFSQFYGPIQCYSADRNNMLIQFQCHVRVQPTSHARQEATWNEERKPPARFVSRFNASWVNLCSRVPFQKPIVAQLVKKFHSWTVHWYDQY